MPIEKNIHDKMYEIAKYLDDLNAHGSVKATQGSEYGYARIGDIKSGLTLFIFHDLRNRLTISLLITKAAGNNYTDQVRKAIQAFKKYHAERFCANVDLEPQKWVNAIGNTDERTHYSIDVTDKGVEAIKEEIVTLRNSFKEASLPLHRNRRR